MIFRNSVLILIFLSLLLPLYADENQAKLYLDKIEYSGNNKSYGNIIRDIVEKEINNHHIFEIIKNKKDAEYFLNCSINEDDNTIEVTMEITGAVSSIREIVARNDNKEVGLIVLVQEAVEYIHTKIFPYEMYIQQNQSYFTTQDMKTLYNQDVINRSSGKVRESVIILFDPLKKKLFDKYRIQLMPSIEVSFPVNLLDNGVHQSPYINLPLHLYLYNTDMFMFSLMAEGLFVPFSVQVPGVELKFNYLNIWGIGGGIGVCFPLPFYEKIGLHLNLSSGWAISILSSELYADKVFYSNDPFFHPTFEIEHTITKHMSISLKISYILILYTQDAENLHLVQSGIGFGIRF